MTDTKIIAVANQKGGVGKTTTAANVAARLNQLGKSVLMLDLDAQGSLTTSFGLNPEALELTISDVFEVVITKSLQLDLVLEQVRIEIKENLWLIPANITLSVIDSLLITKTSREYILKRIINKLITNKKGQPYDYIIMDCPPSLSMICVNALTACNSVIIPVKAQFLDFKGFNQLYVNIMSLKEETNENIEIEGVFLTMYDARLNMAKTVEDALNRMQKDYGVKVYKTKISQCTKAAEASYAGQDIFAYAPASKTAAEYAALVGEITNENESER